MNENKIPVSIKLVCTLCGNKPRDTKELLEINHFGYSLGCDAEQVTTIVVEENANVRS